MAPGNSNARLAHQLPVAEVRRCSAKCLRQCARAALAAGLEGSGLALPVPGVEARCRFHHDLLVAERFRRLRVVIYALLGFLRTTRDRATAPVRYARATIADPPCTARCLSRCVGKVLTAGPEGSGLGGPRGAACRFHVAVIESSELRAARTGVWHALNLLRRVKRGTRNGVRRLGSALSRVIRPVTGTTARVSRLARRVASEGPHVLTAALVRRLRMLVSQIALRVRRLWARSRPSFWWPRVRGRAVAAVEAGLRRSVGPITELVIWAVPKPKPPVRSVVHVSLISHKQYMLSRLARNHGLKGTFVAINTYPGAHLKIGFDYEVPQSMAPLPRFLRAHWYLWTVLAFHDVIHYHFNGFLFDDGSDLRVLQRMGKIVVAHYRGCDLRCRSINMAKNPGLNVCQECSYPVGSCDTDYQRGKIATSRAHSDIRFVTTPDLLDFDDGAEHLPFIAPYAIDFSAIEPAPRPPGVFRVVTSSNHPALDGVRFVRDAVERLAAEGVRIELVEVYRQSFYEALSIYKSADVYCGKLRMGYYNNANIESLMLGVPNMCYVRDEYLDRIPDSPIIVARPDNVYEQLREWVAKPEELKRVGARGPDFVKRHHHADELMTHMILRYNQALHRKVASKYEAALQSSPLH